ncbi:centrosomal protein of 44 kDa isoform X4 [Syngnathoides biaculeatus]|uniref:centrosomal protein of 44 kDa isoform X4 n=1 Tax=Syngnathoides biaculeatus TaxID=300417 RepID=UPI002ADE6569|nr:centrosomal protein of 44 kDa isoform X4 [Syngnathoides biaculeatus]
MSTVMGVVWYNAGMQPTIHPFSVPLIVTRVVGVLESIPPVIRLSAGDPSAFLPILSFTLNTFSPHFAEELVGAGLEVTGKTDLRFTDTLYKVLRDIFHYKPIVSKQQFLQKGFVQRKISTLCDIIHLVLQRDSELKKVGLHQKQGSLCVGYCHGSSVTLKKHIPKVRIPVSHKDTTAEHHSKLTKPDSDLANCWWAGSPVAHLTVVIIRWLFKGNRSRRTLDYCVVSNCFLSCSLWFQPHVYYDVGSSAVIL